VVFSDLTLTSGRWNMLSALELAFRPFLAIVIEILMVGLTASPAERAARQLAWEMEPRKAVELRVRAEFTNSDPAVREKQYGDAYDDHYIETAAGQRFYEHRGLSFKKKVVTRSAHFADGSRFVDIDYSPDDTNRRSVHLGENIFE
jgi:hypothetical protein